MKIHISLVGGQPAPVFYGAYQADPDKVILICSNQTKTEAERLQKMLQKHFQVSLIVFSPSDLVSINSGIDGIRESLNDDDQLSLNLVGGTKFWSLAFYAAFASRPHTDIFLVDQNSLIWDLSSRQSELLYTDIDTNEHLELYGNPIVSFTSFNSYSKEDAETAERMSELWDNRFFRQTFKYLIAVLSEDRKVKLKQQDSGSFTDNHGSRVDWEKPDKAVFSFWGMNGKEEIELCSPHAVSLVFNSGWFEYHVASILSRWTSAKEVRLNCEFPLRGTDSNKQIKNEVDIIVNAGSKLLFVECKTSIFNGTDIDKFATVTKNYGGSGSKAVFISKMPIPEIPMQKCIESGVIPFSFQGHSVEQLYNLLDREIKQINA